MKKYIVYGGKKLTGTLRVSGAKNVITKALIAACLTDEPVVLHNVPRISDVFLLLDIIRHIGGDVKFEGDTVEIHLKDIKNTDVPLDLGAKVRTATMFLAPLIARAGKADVPNPGGCRLGARPIDRHIAGLEKLGISIEYSSDDGYFHAEKKELHGSDIFFGKNSHTGTETILLASVLTPGVTTISNAAAEPEIDDLIKLLNQMGAKIERTAPREIKIEGVEKLSGTEFTISSDRNEFITFAILSALSGGDIHIKNGNFEDIKEFLNAFKKAGGKWVEENNGVRFFLGDQINPVDIVTNIHPGFMTDWQGPWAVLLTQAHGVSTIHETVYENRFAYVEELKKMGCKIEFFKPEVEDPNSFYNFDSEEFDSLNQGIKIYGPSKIHNAVLTIADLRAGATLLLASLFAEGESVIYGIEHLERGYEMIESRLKSIGADITVVDE